ncbi:hypothetical protein [uncultured Dokdonia sp.]|uniref:hypothetical protein n=1 Tax=uncultured Dokdonia sp. TaxID=575653 RepID=UPI0026136399|nr:hypothetical protein [uncultured Dokdonia sp.]
MTLKQQRLFLYFFEVLEAHLRFTESLPLSNEVKALLTREECIKIILWIAPERYQKAQLENYDEEKLHTLLVTDYNILLYIIDRCRKQLLQPISFSEEEIEMLFTQTNNQIHYLYSKNPKTWDSYDLNNYVSLLAKAGFTMQVFGIYSSSVKEEDKYTVDSLPTLFFDTNEEAETEISRLIEEENYSEGALVVYPLWKIK